MKTNLELLNGCDQVRKIPDHFWKLKIKGYDDTFGYIHPTLYHQLQWPSYWFMDASNQSMTLIGSDLQERIQMVKETFYDQPRGLLPPRFSLISTSENFPVFDRQGNTILSIPRKYAAILGIKTYGTQLLAYIPHPTGLKIWIARRAATKSAFPSMLDSTVGGSLKTGETPLVCLIRESLEEASFPAELIEKNAISVGTVNYICLTDKYTSGIPEGLLCPEIMYCYEMPVDENTIPTPNDNEVEEFILMDIDQVKQALGNGEFTPANACVVLDFFIRHGILTPENEKDYIEISSRLHRNLWDIMV